MTAPCELYHVVRSAKSATLRAVLAEEIAPEYVAVYRAELAHRSKIADISARLADFLLDWEGFDSDSARLQALLAIHGDLFEVTP